MDIKVGLRVKERALVIVQYASMVSTEIIGSIRAASSDNERGELISLLLRTVEDNNDRTKLEHPATNIRKDEETPRTLLFIAATFVTEAAKAV